MSVQQIIFKSMLVFLLQSLVFFLQRFFILSGKVWISCQFRYFVLSKVGCLTITVCKPIQGERTRKGASERERERKVAYLFGKSLGYIVGQSFRILLPKVGYLIVQRYCILMAQSLSIFLIKGC